MLGKALLGQGAPRLLKSWARATSKCPAHKSASAPPAWLPVASAQLPAGRSRDAAFGIGRPGALGALNTLRGSGAVGDCRGLSGAAGGGVGKGHVLVTAEGKGLSVEDAIAECLKEVLPKVEGCDPTPAYESNPPDLPPPALPSELALSFYVFKTVSRPRGCESFPPARSLFVTVCARRRQACFLKSRTGVS